MSVCQSVCLSVCSMRVSRCHLSITALFVGNSQCVCLHVSLCLCMLTATANYTYVYGHMSVCTSVNGGRETEEKERTKGEEGKEKNSCLKILKWINRVKNESWTVHVTCWPTCNPIESIWAESLIKWLIGCFLPENKETDFNLATDLFFFCLFVWGLEVVHEVKS